MRGTVGKNSNCQDTCERECRGSSENGSVCHCRSQIASVQVEVSQCVKMS